MMANFDDTGIPGFDSDQPKGDFGPPPFNAHIELLDLDEENRMDLIRTFATIRPEFLSSPEMMEVLFARVRQAEGFLNELREDSV